MLFFQLYHHPFDRILAPFWRLLMWKRCDRNFRNPKNFPWKRTRVHVQYHSKKMEKKPSGYVFCLRRFDQFSYPRKINLRMFAWNFSMENLPSNLEMSYPSLDINPLDSLDNPCHLLEKVLGIQREFVLFTSVPVTSPESRNKPPWTLWYIYKCTSIYAYIWLLRYIYLPFDWSIMIFPAWNLPKFLSMGSWDLYHQIR